MAKSTLTIDLVFNVGALYARKTQYIVRPRKAGRRIEIWLYSSTGMIAQINAATPSFRMPVKYCTAILDSTFLYINIKASPDGVWLYRIVLPVEDRVSINYHGVRIQSGRRACKTHNDKQWCPNTHAEKEPENVEHDGGVEQC
jgi:hypothetical protein